MEKHRLPACDWSFYNSGPDLNPLSLTVRERGLRSKQKYKLQAQASSL
jgi:hypothetical protein